MKIQATTKERECERNKNDSVVQENERITIPFPDVEFFLQLIKPILELYTNMRHSALDYGRTFRLIMSCCVLVNVYSGTFVIWGMRRSIGRGLIGGPR